MRLTYRPVDSEFVVNDGVEDVHAGVEKRTLDADDATQDAADVEGRVFRDPRGNHRERDGRETREDQSADGSLNQLETRPQPQEQQLAEKEACSSDLRGKSATRQRHQRTETATFSREGERDTPGAVHREARR